MYQGLQGLSWTMVFFQGQHWSVEEERREGPQE